MTTNIFALIIVLGVLVFIHELGHFLFARLFGVGVEKFSLGFGPRIIGTTRGITDYRISAIPLGGYVKMVGEEPDAEIDPADIPISFTHKNVFKRIAIVAAGPCFNFLLAVFIFYGIFQLNGIQLLKPVIRDVFKDSPAQNVGLKENDLVVAINGSAIESWDDINKMVSSSEGEELEVSVRREGTGLTVDIVPGLMPSKNMFGEEIERYAIGISGIPVLNAAVGNVFEGTPAKKAGLAKGDLIKIIDGTPIESWNDMKDMISSSKGKPLELTVLRGNNTITLSLIPELITEKNALGEKVDSYRIGISAPVFDDPDAIFTKKLNPIQAFSQSIIRTYELSELIIIGIGKMIQGAISPKELGGPIIIAKMAGDQAREGAENLIFFIAFLSINLAILNFLPIPVLDGGHLLFFTIEAILRRPVSIRVREIAQQGGLIILMSLMIFAFYNDIMRVFFN